jgi:hypothetical protein
VEFLELELSDDERDVLLTALFELRITRFEDAEQAAQIDALLLKLGGDLDAVFFGAYKNTLSAAPVPEHLFNKIDEG